MIYQEQVFVRVNHSYRLFSKSEVNFKCQYCLYKINRAGASGAKIPAISGRSIVNLLYKKKIFYKCIP